MKKAHQKTVGLLRAVLSRLNEGYAATGGASIVVAQNSSRGRTAE